MDLRSRLTEFDAEVEAGNLDAVDLYLAPHYVRHGKRDSTRAEFKQMLADLRTGIPDVRTVTVDALEQGDRVAYRWESLGTHLGSYLGAPPTGRVIRATGITISRFENGLIVEDWATWNGISVLHDLGILPIDKG